MSFEIKLPNVKGWNNNRLTLGETLSSMGDRVLVCVHDADDEPQHGKTALVYKADLIRAAKMLGVGFDEAHDEEDSA